MTSTKGTRNIIKGIAFSAMMLLLLSVTVSSQNNIFINTVYADDNNDNSNNNNNNNNKIKNKSLISDISDQVINTRFNKENIQNILQLIQTQIAQISGQDKATKTINLINSIIKLNPNGPLAQSLLYLSKQQEIGNVNTVNEAALQIAMHVASGSEDIGQIIKQAASHTQQALSSSQSSSSSTLSSLLSSQQSSSSSSSSSSPSPLPGILPSSPEAPRLSAISNSPPIADAGHSRPDQTVNAGSLVMLDGSASHDPDGDPITFTWTQLSGPPVQLSGPNQAKTNFTAPTNLPTGSEQAGSEVVFKLTVTDSSGLSDSDTASILVKPVATPPPPPPPPTPAPTPTPTPTPQPQPQPNSAPIADAGHSADKIVNAGSLVKLDGSASHDPDGDPITFTWTQLSGPPVTLNGDKSSIATFTAPSDLQADTTLSFKLTVTDSHGLSSFDTASILVKHTVTPTPTPNPTPTPTPTPPPQPNSAPIADAGHSADKIVSEGSFVTLDGSASHDPDGDTLSYNWAQISGQSVTLSGENTPKATFTAPSDLQADTTLSFKLTVTDSHGLSSFDTVSILVKHTVTPTPTPNPTPTPTPTPPPSDSAPIAVVGPDQMVNGSSVVTLDGSASHDPDGDTLSYNWTQTSNPLVTLSGENTPKATFTAPTLQEDTALFFKLTVTDKAGLSDSATEKITVKRSGSVTPPPGENGALIYTPKPAGRVFTTMNPSGGNCKSDGIRFNIANDHTLVDRESTWVFTLNNDAASCTDKPWWSPKIGSHGSTGEGSGLYEASVPYSGGFKSMRTEGPHPQYHQCTGYQHGNVPPMPQGKPIGIKTAQWRIPNGVHVEFWYDFTGGGKGPWIKYASLDDTLPGHCNGGSIHGPIGIDGTLIGPAKAQDTMRMNGGDATYISGSIVELAPGQTPKGGVGSSPSSITSSNSGSSSTPLLASSSVADNNSITTEVPHAIAKESIFDKGLSDGQKDAKTMASISAATARSANATAPAANMMTPDDVDCESPDNLSGQDSIDYCKGYDKGFAEQNNLMQGK